MHTSHIFDKLDIHLMTQSFCLLLLLFVVASWLSEWVDLSLVMVLLHSFYSSEKRIDGYRIDFLFLCLFTVSHEKHAHVNVNFFWWWNIVWKMVFVDISHQIWLSLIFCQPCRLQYSNLKKYPQKNKDSHVPHTNLILYWNHASQNNKRWMYGEYIKHRTAKYH